MTDMIIDVETASYATAPNDVKNTLEIPNYEWMGTRTNGPLNTPEHVVGARSYASVRKQAMKNARYVESADSWIREFAREHDISTDQNVVNISLDQINALLGVIGCEPIKTEREYHFTATIEIEITGTVVAESEEDADAHVTDFLENLEITNNYGQPDEISDWHSGSTCVTDISLDEA
jgi:hypothetical protein